MLWIALSIAGLSAQQTVSGVVLEEKANGSLRPLEFVNVYWLSESEGTYTDSTGQFSLKPPTAAKEGGFIDSRIVVSYVGYDPDTILVGQERYLSIVLKDNTTLETVEVVHRKRTTEVSFLDARLVENISQGELFKAACCNLSESFETNASVDVTVTDAISGAKELRMLGLSGRYSMMSREFMPGIRGLAIPYGMLYIPGSWVSSMQLTKGAGSVVNGYESISGQINIEWKKPEDNERFFLNGYVNEMLRTELNANGTVDISPTLQTTGLAHYSLLSRENDRNNDGFADNQTGDMLALANRWKFNNQRGLEGQIGVYYLNEDKTGGQVGYNKDEPGSGLYGVEREAERFEVWGKTGVIFPVKRYQSLGIQWAYSYYDLNTLFGVRPYRGTQQTAYANLIFQSIIGTTDHKFKTGASVMYDHYDEEFEQTAQLKEETAIGGYFEYTYTLDTKLTAVAGLRADYNTLYGVLVTPRLHLRYAPRESTVIRASAGKGYRSPNVIAENLNLLASSREIVINGDNPDLPYGLEMESAWNFGGSVTQEFELDFRPGAVTVEFFRTTFQNQAVVDLDVSPREAVIYNLDGTSYANNYQVEASYEVLKRFDVKLAYRRSDVFTDYTAGKLRAPLVPKDRGFMNLAYTTRTKPGGYWMMDATLQLTGSQRLPTTEGNPEGLTRPATSPAFATVSAQVTRSFTIGKTGTETSLDVYLGVENLFDYTQDDPIIAPDDPFGPYFDSGFVWGPIFGRNIYAGVRYTLDKRDN